MWKRVHLRTDKWHESFLYVMHTFVIIITIQIWHKASSLTICTTLIFLCQIAVLSTLLSVGIFPYLPISQVFSKNIKIGYLLWNFRNIIKVQLTFFVTYFYLIHCIQMWPHVFLMGDHDKKAKKVFKRQGFVIEKYFFSGNCQCCQLYSSSINQIWTKSTYSTVG